MAADASRPEASAILRLLLTLGGFAGQALPTASSLSSLGSSSSTQSGAAAQPASCAEHSMPKLSTPFRLRFSIFMPLPGVVQPTGANTTRWPFATLAALVTTR